MSDEPRQTHDHDSGLPPETVAAVDLGSNSFHLVLAQTRGGQPVVIDRLREMVQLASGLDDRLRLSEESQDAALECLERFGQRLRHIPAAGVRAVGTNTLRSARNAAEFLPAAEEALGHPIETISGIEEARLIYVGVAQSMARAEERRLVIDIGGGSTELIVGQGLSPELMESLYMGSVATTRRFFKDGAIRPERWDRAVLAVRQELAPAESRFLRRGWADVVGSSGTIRAASNVIREMELGEEVITPKSLHRLRDAVLEYDHTKRLKLPGLNPHRRPYFIGGLVVLHTIVEALEIDRVQVAQGALREGLLYDLLGRITDDDVRGRSVSALAERYHVDRDQAERVERTALHALSQVAESWRLRGVEARRLLSWAAQLHEIGLDIAHSHYHKHGEYIVRMADLPGFSIQEQTLLSLLVRAHRRKMPVEEIRELPRKRGRLVERLAILLRLAVVLHRGRAPVRRREVELQVDKRDVDLRFPPGFLEQHAMSRADLEQEASYLKLVRYELTFS